MKQFLFLLVIAVLSVGCGKKKPAAATDKYLDPAFKARQRAKAVQAYEELVANYPDSEYAAQAKRRLDVLKTPAK
jgi:outer membrane protein assembly factor BamD (BamD/ComL family)